MRSRQASPTGRRRAGRRWLLAAVCLAGAAGLAWAVTCWLWQRPSAEEQLRALDAAHAIPDEENAARLYTEIFLDGARPSLDPELLSRTVQKVTLAKTWRSADFPEVAKWVEDRQGVIDALLEASRRPHCWFAVSTALEHGGDLYVLSYQEFALLLTAAGNDLGEGRLEAGLEKLLGVLRMGEHFRAQLIPAYRDAGTYGTAQGWKRLGPLLVAGDLSPDWLARLAAVLPPVEDTWSEDSRREEQMNLLYMEKTGRGLGTRLLYGVVHGIGPGTKAVKGQYLVQLTEFRIARILLELRCYKNETGSWPASLNDIRGRVPPQTLLDPVTRKLFDYRLTGNTFQLQTSDSRRSITGP